MRFALFLNKIRRFDFAVKVIPSARLPDIDIRQQIIDEQIFFMQFNIFKARYLNEKLIEPHKVPHDRRNFKLFEKIVFFHPLFCATEIEIQLFLRLRVRISAIQ